MIKVGIIGATGYAGIELVRLILSHPGVTLTAISSVSFEGKTLNEVYPSLYSLCDLILANEDEVIENSDVVFTSLPHGLSEEIAKKCIAGGKKLIDLGADFRLTDEEDFKEWYGLPYKEKALHKNTVYSIPELHRDSLKNTHIVANPGCYPTGAALALAPAIKAKIIDLSSIIIDSKSGATGAGRALTLNTHFTELNESLNPYKIAQHRHTPEIEQTLSALADEKVTVTFVPHLMAVNRGIVSTIYAKLKNDEDIQEVYQKFYEDEPFVRVLKQGDTATVKNVRFSNFCDISLHKDKRTGRIIIVSVIDNMVKGAAGQAIQNMNILLGLDETAGLKIVPPAI